MSQVRNLSRPPRSTNVSSSSASTRASSPRDERDAELRERSEPAGGGGGSSRDSELRGAKAPRFLVGEKEMRNYASGAGPPEAAGEAVAIASCGGPRPPVS